MISLCFWWPKPAAKQNLTAVELKQFFKRRRPRWVDFNAPGQEEAKLPAEVFKLHSLASEDCFDENHSHTMEKIESSSLLNEMLFSKKKIVTPRRLLTPQRNVFYVWQAVNFQATAMISAYLSAIYDRLLRITESLNSFRDVLSSTLQAHLSVISNGLNEWKC